MAFQQGLGIGCVLVCSGLLAACGEPEKAPDSTIDTTQAGAGGMAGAAGSLTIGNGNGGGLGGSAGQGNPAPPTITTFHTCGMPEQECGSTTHTGDVMVTTKEELAALDGVSRIEGALKINIATGVMGDSEVLDGLECLKSVTGDVSVQFSNTAGDVSLWGLRNLASVGGNLVVSNTFVRTFADCGLAKLTSVGALESVDGSGQLELDRIGGELDLSKLTQLRQLRIHNTELVSVKLPASGTFALSYLQISNNDFLTQVSGFEDVLVQFLPSTSMSGVQLMNNPRLSDCRATALAKLFTTGGAQPAQITQSGNLPCPAPEP